MADLNVQPSLLRGDAVDRVLADTVQARKASPRGSLFAHGSYGANVVIGELR
jgi:hypothetical protein